MHLTHSSGRRRTGSQRCAPRAGTADGVADPGSLRTSGPPIPSPALLDAARELVDADAWPHFVQRRSFDTSKTIAGVRCRINILHSARGVGLAVRLLSSFQATIDTLNLHPDLKRLVTPHNGWW